MTGPHHNQPVSTAGDSLDSADTAVIMIHGRGATARSILQLAGEFDQSNVAYIAPQAANFEWYPNSFLAPVEENEPGRSSGLSLIDSILDDVREAGIDRRQVFLIGFSQGACLASEYVARHPMEYGGLAALSGGLIGEHIEEDDYSGDLEQTPIFLGCSDQDPHIPQQRVHETAAVFEQLNGHVTTRLYEGLGHGINTDEIEHISRMLAGD